MHGKRLPLHKVEGETDLLLWDHTHRRNGSVSIGSSSMTSPHHHLQQPQAYTLEGTASGGLLERFIARRGGDPEKGRRSHTLLDMEPVVFPTR